MLRLFEPSLRSVFGALCSRGGLGEKAKHLSRSHSAHTPLAVHAVSTARVHHTHPAAASCVIVQAKHLSLEEWKAFLRGAELMAADFTERDATMCFAWSRM